MDKFILMGSAGPIKVGVLIHPSHGAGWSSWSDKYGIKLALDKRIIEKVLDIQGKFENGLIKNEKEASINLDKFLCSIGYENVFCDVVLELKLVFVDEGCYIKVEEDDGKEFLEVRYDVNGFIQV